MRHRNRAFLSCAVVAGALLAAPGEAKADTCQAGQYTVSTDGPQVEGTNTKITYTVSGNNAPDHVATVVASGYADCTAPSILSVTGSPLSGNQAYGPAVGDPITGLGKWACHEEAVKVNPSASTLSFTITVSGIRGPAAKSVVVKKGNTVKSCEIVGIGEQDTTEVAPVTEIIREPGLNPCSVEFTRDRITGKVLHAQVTEDSAGNCTLSQTPVENLSLQVAGPFGDCTAATCSLGFAKFGEGYVHSGEGSCTTRVIGGRVYSWGAPCP
jgi:hypothetical protein